MRPISCDEFMEKWDSYRSGQLSEKDCLSLSRHLEPCTKCRLVCDIYQRIDYSLLHMELSPLKTRRIAVAAASFKRAEGHEVEVPVLVLGPLAVVLAAILLVVGIYLGVHFWHV